MHAKLWKFLATLFSLMAVLCIEQNDETYGSDVLFEAAILDTTNAYRQMHNASELYWNRTLSEYAQSWSKGCELRHSDGTYGENMALGYSDVSAAITAWGEEGQEYDFTRAQYSTRTGHFTQLVWKATRSVGCGRSNCQDETSASSRWLIVCEYYEAGNVLGKFAENVQMSLHPPHRTRDHSKTRSTKEPDHAEPEHFRTETIDHTVEPAGVNLEVIPIIEIVLWIVMAEL